MGFASLDRIGQDVRHAARSLAHDRRFTAVAVVVLALGIGGNVTVFSLVNALLLNPFPYPDAQRLVEIQGCGTDACSSTVRIADFGYWQERATAYESIGAYGYGTANLSGQSLPGLEAPERIATGRATQSFLRVLGVAPALGRFFSPEEDRPGGAPVAVLSHGAWLRRFGGRRDVLGATVTMDGIVRTIVGVMPTLRLPGMATCEVWVPASYDIATNMQPGYDTRYDGDQVIARLRPDVTAARAQAELDVLVARLEHDLPRETRNWHVRVIPLGSDLLGSDGSTLRLLMLVVGAGLVLACVNLAGLLLARSTSQAREIAVRACLGAGRSRLIRYALAESLLLALAAGGLGLGLAAWGVHAIGAAAPRFMGLDSALRIDAPVLVFAVGLSLLTGIACGLVPAIHGSRADLAVVLKGTASGGRTRQSGRLLSTLVVVEITLALLLLAGGGLTARSLVELLQVDTGIASNNLLTFHLSLTGPKYASASRRLQLVEELLARLRRSGGIVATAGVGSLPMGRQYSGGGFAIEGRPAPSGDREMAQYCQATPGYFRAMGVPILLGREFEPGDGTIRQVVLVNQEFARRYLPGESALGRRISGAGAIVGVTGNVRHDGPERPPDPQICLPFAARPPVSFTVVLATSGPPLDRAPVVRQQLRALDPSLPADRMQAMSDIVADSMADVRMATSLIGGFAAFALALAAIGLYGVIAYAVGQREHEMGIRIALGATRRQVLSLLLSRGVLLAVIGIAIGMPAALASTRVMGSLLYGVGPRDPAVFAAVPSLLLFVALLASYLAARHAAGTDPAVLLRRE